MFVRDWLFFLLSGDGSVFLLSRKLPRTLMEKILKSDYCRTSDVSAHLLWSVSSSAVCEDNQD